MLSRLIAQIESNHHANAIRYEPGFNPDPAMIAKVIKAWHPCKISRATAEMVLRTSWGKFQLMGENLYRLGYNKSVFSFVADEAEQLVYFEKFIVWRGINYSLAEMLDDEAKLNKFAKRYNGSTAYAATMLNGVNALRMQGHDI